MKYLKQLDDGAWAAGHLRPARDCDDGEIVFFAEQCFDTREEAEDYVAGKNDKYRVFANAYVVPRAFGEDLCRKADEARKARDNAAKECGGTVTSHAAYRGDDGLECYGARTDYAGDVDALTDECRRFWARQNYLFGLADAAYELGFTLCWNAEEQRHVMRGKVLEPVIREA